MKPVTVIGMGLSPDDLTERHKQIIRKADVLMGGQRHLSSFKDTPALKKEITRDLKGAIDFIRTHMPKMTIVVLASGDPLFFGIGAIILDALGPDQVEVLPNISSIAGAFSRIKEPWSDVKVISLHGRDRESELLKAIKTHKRVAVFTDPKKTPAWLADFLISKSSGDISIGVFERLGAPDEKIGWYDLEEAALLDFAEPNVVILKGTKQAWEAAPALHLGMAEEAFDHEGGLITKPEIRAVTLAKLSLLPHHTLWDLGAGSGSVAIEAALFVTHGKIFAVEEKAERIEQIRTNISRFGATCIEVIQTVLPAGLEALPSPDRVFIGGGEQKLDQIIGVAASVMTSGGVMVINAVLLDNLEATVKTLREFGFETEVIQVQIQRSKAMPWSQRFEAQNPVWIISGRK